MSKSNAEGNANEDHTTGAILIDNKSSNSIEISDDPASMMATTSKHCGTHGGGLMSAEITEIVQEDTTSSSLFSVDINNAKEVVYVGVGGSQTSMDALLWTLHHACFPPNALVCLVHVFPPLKFVPSPMGAGKMPMSQVSPDLAETYLAQHQSEVRQLLNKYMDKCNLYQVPADTILIEGESVTNAILDLTSVLSIPKLVVGISKSKLKSLQNKKSKGEKGSGIVAQHIMLNAPVECEIKVICDDKDVSDQLSTASPPPKSKSPAASPKSVAFSDATTRITGMEGKQARNPEQFTTSNSFSCCFKLNL